MQQYDVIFLMGPTAIGKTAVAMELARQLPVDLISVDSAMVYRGMNIGSGKPTAAELKTAPHRLVDIRDPDNAYSAGDFCKDALQHIKEIKQAGKIPLLVGGTALYFHALQFGIAELPAADDAIREELEKTAAAKGWPYMHQWLQEVDAVSASKIHANDKQRISRALEVFLLTAKPLSRLQNTTSGFSYRALPLIIMPDSRTELKEVIRIRFEQMLQQGLLSEVEGLLQHFPNFISSSAARAVGYSQALDFLAGKYSLAEMKKTAIIATRQLAKRQLTWFRHWPQAEFLVKTADSNMCELVEKQLKVSFFC